MTSCHWEGFGGDFSVDATLQQTVYEFSAPLLNRNIDGNKAGRILSLSEFKGRVLLIVNTASKCGFTPQYAGLEALYREHKDRGFEVLAFTCNQFGAQEPGTDAQIRAFCAENYGVTFPIFARIDVNGTDTHPLYKFLKKSRPGIFGVGRITWNFTKFLVDRKGYVVARYSPSLKPESLSAQIQKLLDGQ
jgi:glutathione peroxidase